MAFSGYGDVPPIANTTTYFLSRLVAASCQALLILAFVPLAPDCGRWDFQKRYVQLRPSCFSGRQILVLILYCRQTLVLILYYRQTLVLILYCRQILVLIWYCRQIIVLVLYYRQTLVLILYCRQTLVFVLYYRQTLVLILY